MLFAEELGPVSVTAIILGAIGTVGGGLGWLLTFLRKNKKEDEESTLGHFKTLLERERKECRDEIDELRARITAIETKYEAKVETQARALNECRDRLADALSRNRYLVAKCRDNNLKIDPWELPPDSATHTALGG